MAVINLSKVPTEVTITNSGPSRIKIICSGFSQSVPIEPGNSMIFRVNTTSELIGLLSQSSSTVSVVAGEERIIEGGEEPAPAPELLSAVAILSDDSEVSIIEGALTLTQGSVLDRVLATVSVPVTLNGTPRTEVNIDGVWYPHGNITVNPEDPTEVIITPIGSNGICASLGEIEIRVPANAVKNGAAGNAEIIIALTVEEAVVLPEVLSIEAILRDERDVMFVEGSVTLEQYSVTSFIRAQMSVPVALVGTPKAYITLGETEYPYGNLSIDLDDNTLVIVTPDGTNGTAALVGTHAFRIPAGSVSNLDNANWTNEEVNGSLTVVEAEAAIYDYPADTGWTYEEVDNNGTPVYVAYKNFMGSLQDFDFSGNTDYTIRFTRDGVEYSQEVHIESGIMMVNDSGVDYSINLGNDMVLDLEAPGYPPIESIGNSFIVMASVDLPFTSFRILAIEEVVVASFPGEGWVQDTLVVGEEPDLMTVYIVSLDTTDELFGLNFDGDNYVASLSVSVNGGERLEVKAYSDDGTISSEYYTADFEYGENMYSIVIADNAQYDPTNWEDLGLMADSIGTRHIHILSSAPITQFVIHSIVEEEKIVASFPDEGWVQDTLVVGEEPDQQTLYRKYLDIQGSLFPYSFDSSRCTNRVTFSINGGERLEMEMEDALDGQMSIYEQYDEQSGVGIALVIANNAGHTILTEENSERTGIIESVGTSCIGILSEVDITSFVIYSIEEVFKENISDASIAVIDDQVYTGSAIEPAPVVTFNGNTLTEITDYTLGYANNVNAGEATITITGVGNFAGAKEITFNVVEADIGTATIDAIPDQSHTGSAIEPVPVVTFNDTTLTVTTDYTVSYTNNTDLGTATVTVTGVGNFTSSKDATFEIVS